MPRSRPPLTVEQILAWADAHHARTGRWPQLKSGPIPEAAGETWTGVNMALYKGHRGFPGGCSLLVLLDEYRGRGVGMRKPPLSVEQVLAWARAHRRRTGRWPHAASGGVTDAPEETWAAVNAALYHGSRGLPGGDSLARLLRRHRGEKTNKQERTQPSRPPGRREGGQPAHE
jgi:hypothetical protein